MAETPLDVNTVIFAANEILRKVAGIKYVYDEAPDQAPSGQLPCIVPMLRKITPSNPMRDILRHTYTIEFWLMVTPGNKTLPSQEKQARPLGDAVLKALGKHIKLGNCSLGDAKLLPADYGVLPYNPQQSYLGWLLTLEGRLDFSITQEA
jgi:hypothetical protein